MDKWKTPQANAKARKLSSEIGMDQKKAGQNMLSLGHYDNNQIEMFASSHTKTSLSVGHNHINQAGIFTSTHH